MTLDRVDIVVKWFGATLFSVASGFVATISLVGRAAAPFVVELADVHWGYAKVLMLASALLGVAGATFVWAERARDIIRSSARSLLPGDPGRFF